MDPISREEFAAHISGAGIKPRLVRELTDTGLLARTQLREDIVLERRIERLRTKIRAILANLV